jgi:hypothetical protein
MAANLGSCCVRLRDLIDFWVVRRNQHAIDTARLWQLDGPSISVSPSIWQILRQTLELPWRE